MSEETGELSTAQKARIERNRLKAVMLKESKLILRPSAKLDTGTVQQAIIKVQGTKFIDTGGGFLLEENPTKVDTQPTIVTKPPPIIERTLKPTCIECNQEFSSSYLFETFDYHVCDNCRDNEDKHSLITKTEAKKEYLLQDCDLEKREPPLKCIVRKNPHNNRWGSMKLYLHIQVEERALQVWGSKEALLEEKDAREEKRDVAKSKKYSKQLKELRMNVRSSLFDKTKGSFHTHEYGNETYDEDDDVYMHTCTTCGHVETYEKM